MTTEKFDKDREFLRTVAVVAAGVEPLEERVARAGAARLEADYLRIQALLDNAPPERIQALAAAHSQAQLEYVSIRDYYYEAVMANAEYIRKLVLK